MPFDNNHNNVVLFCAVSVSHFAKFDAREIEAKRDEVSANIYEQIINKNVLWN